MISTLMVSQDAFFFQGMEPILADNHVSKNHCKNAKNALSILENEKIDLLVIDERLPDMTAKQFIEQVLFMNPMINCAIASPWRQKTFHDLYEGCGVLMQLSMEPGPNDAKMLMDQVNQIKTLQAQSHGPSETI